MLAVLTGGSGETRFRSSSLLSIVSAMILVQSECFVVGPGRINGNPFTNVPPGRTCHQAECTFRVRAPIYPRRFQSLEPLRSSKKEGQMFENEDPKISDSVARRQLLFSMLTSATALSLPLSMRVDEASAVTEAGTSNIAVANAAAWVATTNILKPPLDNRKYETMILENGLRVLLCSDPASNVAAAAMDVHVGACSDPPEVPGLAHFNEHMLFLGTEDYPAEGSFEKYLTSNGGSSNAFTASEDTVYYFDIVADSDVVLAEGMKRFGSFFTSPLFTESATGRELNAIESENSKNLQSDTFRLYQIEKSRSNSAHPYSKFFTGNKATLLDGTKRAGLNLRDELVKFYGKYYSANQMSLAIVAPQSLPKLKELVQSSFSSIPNRETRPPEVEWAHVPPFLEGASIIPAEKNIVEIVPVQDLRQVTCSWPIVYKSKEDSDDIHLMKPDYFVMHLMGHEGPGSLLSYLKNQGWANSFGAGTNAELSDFETFDVTVELTFKGLTELDKVIESIFSYIRMLRQERVPAYVFDEVLQLSELEWRFATKGNPGSYVQSLVKAMVEFGDISPSLVVAGPRRVALKESLSRLQEPRVSFSSSSQREETISATLDFTNKLTVDDAIITVLSKSFEGKTSSVETWYGTAYNTRPVSVSTLNAWQNCAKAADLGVAYPKPNVFIPEEKGLRVKKKVKIDEVKAMSFEGRMTPRTPPKIIRDNEWTVYFKQDDRFGEPKAFLIFQLLTKEVYSSEFFAALATLYQSCVVDAIEEYAYDATLAGLSYDVQVLPRGVRLTFGGYNDKLEDFAAYVARKLSRDVGDILPKNDAEFDRYKDRLMRALSAFDVKQPYAHAIYYSSLTLQPRNFQYTNEQLRSAMRQITLPDLLSYSSKLWSSGKGEALIQGNLDEKEALALVDKIDKTLAFKTVSAEEYPPRLKALPLPLVPSDVTPTRLTSSEPNPSNKNAAVQVLLQSLGETEKDHVLIEVLDAILHEPFYEDLRTNQQLGYIVSSGVKAVAKTRNINFVVQSSVAPAEKLTNAVLKFLSGVRKTYLEPLNQGDTTVYVKSLLDKKTEPDKKLVVEVTRNWAEISSGRLQFDRTQKEAAALLDISKEDILEFWDLIYGGSPNGRRILVSEVVPRSGPASSKSPATSTGYAEGNKKAAKTPGGSLRLGVNDIEQFRRDREQL
uniref:Insulin-degrading enzyme n=2 Tax=Odontella aurita TaxID=265563 RepID=A0A7S4JKR1_9STRA|mmetsp:Transcript_47707/g.144261  ORF Transcript_47707/g.144261 Transcript_47707/m.144261 type:complete len:1175 (+) Transcript_47707:344-3868(+)